MMAMLNSFTTFNHKQSNTTHLSSTVIDKMEESIPSLVSENSLEEVEVEDSSPSKARVSAPPIGEDHQIALELLPDASQWKRGDSGASTLR